MEENSGMCWIVVEDVKKSIDYYTKLLGYKLEEYIEEYGWAELSHPGGGVSLGIAKSGDCDPTANFKNAVFIINVDNIEKSKADMKKKGVQFKGDILEVPGHVKLLLGVDSDGNHFQLAERLQHKSDMNCVSGQCCH